MNMLPRGMGTQRGAATLVVVMVLFFIVALVAAYTSRNLIFEQRTSANQYRATQAFEAAEAGLEWALTMLNSGKITTACQPHVDPATGDDSFRQRYLNIDPGTGVVTPHVRAGGPLQAACVFDGNGWQCSCPRPTDDVAPALAAPAGDGPFPAFVVRFFDNTPPYPPAAGPPFPQYPPGVVRVQSTGCTRLEEAGTICANAASSGDGRATVTSLVALKSGLATPPDVPLTVRGNLFGADHLRLTKNGGLILRVGGSDVSGTPHATAVWPDAALADPALSGERMFASVFAAFPNTYRLQPAAVHVKTCPQNCSAATVRDLWLLNPGRVLWIDGDFDLNIAEPIGGVVPAVPPDLPPVVIIIDGNLTVSHAAAQVNGVVYVKGNTFKNTGALTLTGALVAEGALTLDGAGISNVAYNADVLNRLKRTSGSFVRVPGSWRDF